MQKVSTFCPLCLHFLPTYVQTEVAALLGEKNSLHTNDRLNVVFCTLANVNVYFLCRTTQNSEFMQFYKNWLKESAVFI